VKFFEFVCVHCCCHLQDELDGRKYWIDVTGNERTCKDVVQWEGPCGRQEDRAHSVLFILITTVKVELVSDYFNGFQDAQGAVSVDASKASVLSESSLPISVVARLCFCSLGELYCDILLKV
jgi:hypothetical protein